MHFFLIYLNPVKKFILTFWLAPNLVELIDNYELTLFRFQFHLTGT